MTVVFHVSHMWSSRQYTVNLVSCLYMHFKSLICPTKSNDGYVFDKNSNIFSVVFPVCGIRRPVFHWSTWAFCNTKCNLT